MVNCIIYVNEFTTVNPRLLVFNFPLDLGTYPEVKYSILKVPGLCCSHRIKNKLLWEWGIVRKTVKPSTSTLCLWLTPSFLPGGIVLKIKWYITR